MIERNMEKNASKKKRTNRLFLLIKLLSRHNIIELIETEKEYVKDLALIVEVRFCEFRFLRAFLICVFFKGYMNITENEKDIKKPTGLVGLERVVFGNVQRIYEFHREYVQSNFSHSLAIGIYHVFSLLARFFLNSNNVLKILIYSVDYLP